MMRASVGDILRENIDWLVSLLATYRKDWNKNHPERYMQIVLNGDEAQQLIEDLREVLGAIEKEGDHGATTA